MGHDRETGRGGPAECRRCEYTAERRAAITDYLERMIAVLAERTVRLGPEGEAPVVGE